METTTRIKKILVIVLDNLGDTVMATAVLKPLKRLYPHAHIGFWVKRYAADLFLDHSIIDTVHSCDPFWDKSPGGEKGAWAAFWKTFWGIRRAKYDMAVVLNAEWRRAGMAWMAGIPIRVGLNRRKSRLFLTQTYSVPQPLHHFVNDHLLILENWGEMKFRQEECLPRLELNSEEKNIWRSWSQATGWAPHSFMAIHPFSGDKMKNWPISCWIDLLRKLIAEKKDSRFLLFCGPGEEDRLSQIQQDLPSQNVRVLTPSSVSVLKALTAKALLLVGGDSGPGHIAAALGVPVLSLFAPTNPERSRPLGHAMVRVIHKDAMNNIHVSDVSNAIEEMLGAKV